jgi:hypothetical protein
MKNPTNTKSGNGKARQLTLVIIIAIVLVVMWAVWWYFEARIKTIK